MIIHYNCVGHSRFHVSINDGAVFAVIHKGHSMNDHEMYIVRPYGALNHLTFTGQTRYHAVKELLKFLGKGLIW